MPETYLYLCPECKRAFVFTERLKSFLHLPPSSWYEGQPAGLHYSMVLCGRGALYAGTLAEYFGVEK